jgi:hypothetical protein
VEGDRALVLSVRSTWMPRISPSRRAGRFHRCRLGSSGMATYDEGTRQAIPQHEAGPVHVILMGKRANWRTPWVCVEMKGSGRSGADEGGFGGAVVPR